MEHPVLSLVIPTFNRVELLKQCLKPLLAEHLSWEVIVIDDASNDGTAVLMESLSKTTPKGRLLYRRLTENMGAQVCRNLGLESASARLVAFVDSDDVFLPDGAQFLIDHLQGDPTLDYVYGNVARTNELLEPLSGQTTGAPFSDDPRELAGYHWHTMGAIYRQEFLRTKVGSWNEQLTGSQDWEYQARVKMAKGKGRHVDVLVGYWREHAGPRVGTKGFRLDYILSTLTAIRVVADLAEKSGQSGTSLRRRLAQKAMLMALECGCNSRPVERRACFKQAMALTSEDFSLRVLSKVFDTLPPVADGWVWRRIRRWKGVG